MKVIKENENQNIIWHYSCIFYNMPGAWIWFVSGQNRKCSHGTKAYAFNGKQDYDFNTGKLAYVLKRKRDNHVSNSCSVEMKFLPKEAKNDVKPGRIELLYFRGKKAGTGAISCTFGRQLGRKKVSLQHLVIP
ncbi:hypothetical protein D7V94_05510 [Parablautia intestinalis]|uniref:Uncharacterized protein n=1 Tax=Parablautia intestinalis TaxID=2320100 RepID=A0A3A9AN06_9FIRM|nr:hypothetical protein [Parablautia intestinalis]RKI92782.1 hypothetical protein D7V94_05510 [Parablautia intestinalis]